MPRTFGDLKAAVNTRTQMKIVEVGSLMDAVQTDVGRDLYTRYNRPILRLDSDSVLDETPRLASLPVDFKQMSFIRSRSTDRSESFVNLNGQPVGVSRLTSAGYRPYEITETHFILHDSLPIDAELIYFSWPPFMEADSDGEDFLQYLFDVYLYRACAEAFLMDDNEQKATIYMQKYDRSLIRANDETQF